MADTNNTSSILSVYATTGERIKDLPIRDGNLIFVHDKRKIALDFDGKRKFYNQIEELNTEAERKAILAPLSGAYYFIIETAVLWTYQSGWIQVTSKPEQIVFIGTELPELGNAKTLYVNKADRIISVWDEEVKGYTAVSDFTMEATEEDILNLFK